MSDLDVVPGSADASDAAKLDTSGSVADRRRPGRGPVSPELVPLLRETPDSSWEHDDSAPIRGIALSILLSAPIYAGLFFAVRWVLR